MEPGTGFLFIQETGNKPHEKRVRSDIKMHVADRLVTQKRMRQKKGGEGRRELWVRDGNGNGLLHEENEEASALPLVAREARSSPFRRTSAQDMLGVSGVGIQMNEQTKFFLHHFLHHTSKSLCTVTTETGWLAYAVTNQTLFYSTLYHWVLLNQESLPSELKKEDRLLKLKGTAIRMINRDFLETEEGVMGDELVASVTCLASVNWLIGDFEEAGFHFRGLKAMISRRKGVGNLGFGGLIGRLVRWTDSCRAQVSNTHLSLDQTPLEHPLKSTGLTQNNTLLENNVIERLRSVSLELIATPRDFLPPERRVTLGQQFLDLDRELLSLIHGDTYIHQPIFAIFALAALIYSECVLRGMKRCSRVIKTIVGLLKSRILEFISIDRRGQERTVGRLFWAVVIGVLATEKWSQEGMWFLDFFVGKWGLVEGMWERVCELQDQENESSPKAFYWVLGDEVLDMGTVVTLE